MVRKYTISAKVDKDVRDWIEEMSKKIEITPSEFIFTIMEIVKEGADEEKLIKKIKEKIKERITAKYEWEIFQLGL